MNEIFKRYSTRAFTDVEVKKEDINLLLKAGMQAPSAGNQQPWEFIVVDDRNTLDELAYVSPYSVALMSTPLAIVILAKSDDELKFSNCKIQDLSACAQNILLQATSQELCSLWVSLEPYNERKDFVKNLLDIPENREAFAIICIGYSEKNKEQTLRFDESRVHFNKY